MISLCPFSPGGLIDHEEIGSGNGTENENSGKCITSETRGKINFTFTPSSTLSPSCPYYAVPDRLLQDMYHRNSVQVR